MKPKDLLDDLETGDRSMEQIDPKEPEGPSMADLAAAVRYVTPSMTWGSNDWGMQNTYVTYTQASSLAQSQNQMNTASQLSGAFQQAYGQSMLAGLGQGTATGALITGIKA